MTVAGRARRVLITGLSSQLGGRLAQSLERDPTVEAIIGIDTEDPRHELARTEFVRVAVAERPLSRILEAAAIGTVLDTRLLADPLLAPLSRIREVAGPETDELLRALAAPGSPVTRLVVKSSAAVYGWRPGAPAFLAEDMAPEPTAARTAVQRALLEAEAAVSELANARQDLDVAVLRCADEVGGEGRNSLLTLLALPVLPAVLGFDPRFQLIHAEDVVGVLAHAAHAARADGRGIRGTVNAAADGVLALSEIASLLGKPLLPVLPPWGTVFAAAQLRRVGLRVPVEMLSQLRYGRGLDNRRLKASGYRYRYTTREALIKLRADQRLRPLLGRGEGDGDYTYDPDLEEFLRWCPSVRGARDRGAPAPGATAGDIDSLATSELIELIESLEPEALVTLREYERAHQGREAVLDALESTLSRKQS
jgi:UDP-glucose 4-epimerase